jgi:hypothetical protein
MAKRSDVIIREKENMQTDRCGNINGQKYHTHKAAEKKVNTRVNV